MAIINMDVDGVCLDFTGGLLQELRLRNHQIPLADHVCWREWNFLQGFPSKLKEAAYEVLARTDFWARLDPMPGAQAGIRALREAGHTIHWVTSPWISCEGGWDTARRHALDRHFAHPDQDLARHLFLMREKQWKWGEAFVDDRAESVVAWQERHPEGKALLFEGPLTRDVVLPRFRWELAHLRELIEVLNVRRKASVSA